MGRLYLTDNSLNYRYYTTKLHCVSIEQIFSQYFKFTDEVLLNFKVLATISRSTFQQANYLRNIRRIYGVNIGIN